MREKDPRAVSSDQTETAQKPQSAAPEGGTSNDTTPTSSTVQNVRLYCCLPKGETYTEQPYNKKACALESRARAWLKANCVVWAKWVEEVEESARSGTRWSCQLLAEKARAYDLVDSNGEPFKVNNDLRPALARILCEEVPGACPYVELRTSIFERAYIERQNRVD
mgnify:CR=1 FL=1